MEFVIAPIILLGLLIFIHEFGHFIVAKQLGVGVEKFSLGFGKKLISKKIRETEYLLCAIPLGGYIKMTGEDPDDEVKHPEKSFLNKPVWVRLAVVIAGPVFNLLLAVFIYSGVFMYGIEVLSEKAVVGKVKDNYPAKRAGLIKNDLIIEIDDKPISSWLEMAEIISKSQGKTLEMKIKREGQIFKIKIVPHIEKVKDSSGKETEYGLIGIERKLIIEKYGVLEGFQKGVTKTWEISKEMYSGLKKLILGEVARDQLGGPIFIVQMAGKIAQIGYLQFLYFTAVISINLGIMNLLPIPILDGGHIFFFLIEAIFRKPINLNIREKAQQLGLFVLISIMIFAFYNDIMRWIK